MAKRVDDADDDEDLLVDQFSIRRARKVFVFNVESTATSIEQMIDGYLGMPFESVQQVWLCASALHISHSMVWAATVGAEDSDSTASDRQRFLAGGARSARNEAWLRGRPISDELAILTIELVYEAARQVLRNRHPAMTLIRVAQRSKYAPAILSAIETLHELAEDEVEAIEVIFDRLEAEMEQGKAADEESEGE